MTRLIDAIHLSETIYNSTILSDEAKTIFTALVDSERTQVATAPQKPLNWQKVEVNSCEL